MMERRHDSRAALALLALVLASCDGSHETPTTPGAQLGTAGAVAPLHRAGADAIAGEYLVVLRRGTGGMSADAAAEQVAAQAVAEHGARVHATWDHALRGFAATMSEQAVEALRRDDAVAYIEENAVVRADGIQPIAPWGLGRIAVRSFGSGDYTWTATGAGVRVYLLDTGIRTTHFELGGRASIGADFVNDVAPAGTDCNGHGTHVAGTVTGGYPGVAKAARVVGVKVLGCDGSGTTAGVIAGIDWVVRKAIRPAAANLALNGPNSAALTEAVTGALRVGLPVVVSAGNQDRNACEVSPANIPDAITVGSSEAYVVNTYPYDRRSPFSNWGNCLDLFAPGGSVHSAWNTGDLAYATISGTSMASAHVAGVAALFLETNPTATPAQVRNAIVNTATVGKIDRVGLGSPNLLLYSLLTPETARAAIGTTPDSLRFQLLRLPAPTAAVAGQVPLDVGAGGSGNRKAVSGSEGGLSATSFPSSSSQRIGLSNNGTVALEWEAITTRPWLTLDLHEGALGPGSSLPLVVTVDQSGLALGNHSGALVFTGANAARSPDTVPVLVNVSPAPTLTLGTPISGLSSDVKPRIYVLDVPAGLDRLTITTSGASSPDDDVDLYVSYGAPPTLSAYHCAPLRDGNEESCSFDLPPGGTWYVMLHAFNVYFHVTLLATAVGIPGAPQELTATAVSKTQVDLSWTDGSVNETAFTLQRSVRTEGVWGAWFPLGNPAANATSASDATVGGGTTLRYRIRACNVSGCSAWATSAPVTTPVPPLPPSAVTSAVASTTEIDVGWTDGSDNEAEFVVQRRMRKTDLSYTGWAEVARQDAGQTTFHDSGLLTGRRYQYRVMACNLAGCSDWAQGPLVQIPPLPAAPQGVGAKVISATQIKVDWQDKSTNEASFRLEQRVDFHNGAGWTPYDFAAQPATNVKTRTVAALTGGYSYQYRLQACNAAGCSAWAESGVAFLPLEEPAAPSSLSVAASSGSAIALTWTDNSSDEGDFHIQWRIVLPDGSSTPPQTLSRPAANATAALHTGLTGGTTYRYRIRACNVIGCSAWTAQATATVPTAMPAAPTQVTSALGAGSSIDVGWTDASTDESSFRVQRRVRPAGGVFGTFEEVAQLPANTTGYHDAAVTSGNTYLYRVRSCNVLGCASSANGPHVVVP